ncbi:uncharacterized protein ISCGN_005146 [Ixodes scapularis]
MQTLSFVQVLLTAALAATSPTSPGNLLHDPLTQDDSRIAAKHVATGPPMLSPTMRPDPDAYIFDAWQHSSSGTSRDPCLRRRLQKPTTRDGQLGHDIARETMQTLSFVQVLLTAVLATTSPTSPGNLLHDPLTRDDSRIAAKHVATGPPMLSPTLRPDPDAYIFDVWQHSSSGT